MLNKYKLAKMQREWQGNQPTPLLVLSGLLNTTVRSVNQRQTCHTSVYALKARRLPASNPTE